MLKGSAEAHVTAVCQRCLEPFELRLCIEPELLLLDTDEVAEGYEDLEVWELDERIVRPQDIVEELLIMAMPFSAVHDNMADCRAFSPTESSVDEGAEKLLTPFAALRSQIPILSTSRSLATSIPIRYIPLSRSSKTSSQLSNQR